MKKIDKIIELPKNINEDVEFIGRIGARREQGKITFIEVGDSSGTIQVVFPPDKRELYEKAKEISREEFKRPSISSIQGTVRIRPKGMENPGLVETGGIEVKAINLEILDSEKPSPIPLDTDGYEIEEEVRLKYRYLDLRRKRLQKNLRLRHQIIKSIRDYLNKEGFIEVETPILTKSTPEGARDFVIPSRLHSGRFYALPQSPQQYKQLLMVADVEKYFQVARCFRDEDTRGDRQPEFTQLDMEMSRIKEERDIMDLIEKLMIEVVGQVEDKKISQKPFPVFSYQEAISKFGADKFDLRKNKDDKNELAFAWVINPPFFEKSKEGEWTFTHNPFSASFLDRKRGFGDWLDESLRGVLKDSDMANIKAAQYDLVLNGFEIGGGSIRNINVGVLVRVFQILGYSKEKIQRDFQHMIEAFNYGVPPHGGIALGLDRLVMILVNEPNIREVIAFPKTGDARDPMMDSPSEIDRKQLKELGLEIKKK
ncbi:MAG: aspartyl-tRNA synthetase [Parcubacteria group bacterium Gr01-1014_2]|nr:MAG: aspartyl-tRNA synthetase [Parcubacteria group bacterium Gr01-1014_2]